MRRTLLGLIAALALTTSMRAQQAPQKPQNMVARVVRASLAGIALTDAEKAKLETVKGIYAPRFQSVGAATKPIRARMKAARQANDSAAVRAARRDLAEQRKQGIAVLHAALDDVRSSLTAEHQPQFDHNLVRVRRMIRNRLTP
jgi:hypothetical protein